MAPQLKLPGTQANCTEGPRSDGHTVLNLIDLLWIPISSLYHKFVSFALKAVTKPKKPSKIKNF